MDFRGGRKRGLPIKVWCKENYVDYKTYYYRLRKLRSMFIEERKGEMLLNDNIYAKRQGPKEGVSPHFVAFYLLYIYISKVILIG